MSSTDKDNKAADASADDAVPYIVTDAPTSSTSNNTTTTTTTVSPTVASKEGAKKDSDAVHDDDDDDLQVHPAVTTDTATPTVSTPPAEAAPAPALVSAPVPAPSPQEAERLAKLAILTEAFPTVEKEICEFVLETHRGDVEASINALLEMSDPEYRPEVPQPPQQPSQQQQQQRAPARPPQQQIPQQLPLGAVPPLPQRSPPIQDGTDAAAGEFARMRLQQQPRAEIDPILLASTSTSEQQLRADEDFARTLAAMDEYRARREQPRPQQEEQGPSFAQEVKELMDEELPKIKEKFNAAADTTKKKVNEWYEKFKASRAEAAAREAARQEQANASNEAYYHDGRRSDIYRQDTRDFNREPIRFGERHDSEEPLARHRATPPLPARRNTQDGAASIHVESDTTTTLLPDGRRTTVEEVADKDH